MKTSKTSFDLTTEFHQLYHQYKRPEYLQIAANLGKSTPDNFKEIWERKVNEGCERNKLPKIYD